MQQTWSASGYNEHARFVSDLAGGVLDWLAPKAGERILDLGCGDGVLTERLVSAGCDAIGVDTSESMVAAARVRGIKARTLSGERLDYDGQFDAVFSNAALHWMLDADFVVRGIARALVPGGRFVAEFGGHGNIAAIATALRAVATIMGGDRGLVGPWYFPTPADYSRLLQSHGFEVDRIALFPRPTLLPTGIGGWMETFAAPFFAQFGARQPEALALAEELLRASLRDPAGEWTADYVRLRVRAVRVA